MALNFGKLDFAVSFNRQTAFPLDANSYFESYEEAVKAAESAAPAGSNSSVHYFGEIICVVDIANDLTDLYVINTYSELTKIGSNIEINENAFVKNVDGKLDLYGFADAVAGAQLTVGADGKLAWVKPDTTTVEGLSTAVEGLRTDVGALQTSVGTLQTELGKKANADDVYTKEDADTAIAAAVAGASHLSREIVSEEQLAALIADPSTAKDNVIYMQKVSVNGEDKYKEYMRFGTEGSYAIEMIGDTSVDLSDYATIDSVNTALESYAKSADVKSTTDALSERITTNADEIAKKADTTVVSALEEAVNDKASQADLTALTSTVNKNTNDITALTTEVGKKASQTDLTSLIEVVNGHTTTLGNKVDKKFDEDGGEWTLLSPSNTAKLAKLVIGDDGLEISGKVAAGNVEGLADWITGKRGTLPGLLSADKEAKLDGIAEGAQINVIEAIKLAGQEEALAIENKTVELPFATGEIAGIVKTSAEVGLDISNALEIKSLNVNKLV